MHPKPELQTPPDFPQYTDLGAVAGIQPKYAARLKNGKFAVGLTVEEFYSR